MHLRIYIGFVLSIIAVIAFVFLGIENQKRRAEINHLDKILKLKYKEIQSPPPLPVCIKGEHHAGCRPLTAEETVATVRGFRDEVPDN